MKSIILSSQLKLPVILGLAIARTRDLVVNNLVNPTRHCGQGATATALNPESSFNMNSNEEQP